MEQIPAELAHEGPTDLDRKFMTIALYSQLLAVQPRSEGRGHYVKFICDKS
jgi:hypothetical protein